MDSSKEAAAGAKSGDQILAAAPGADSEASDAAPDPPAQRPSSRRPFTGLSQVDADLALARTLQEQEAAYMMLQAEGGGYGSSEEGSFVDGEGFDVYDFGDGSGYEDGEYAAEDYEGEAHGIDVDDVDDGRGVDPGEFESDEAYAIALQLREVDLVVDEEEIASRLMAFAGLNDWDAQADDEQVEDGQDGWQNIDPDELTYEELIALGDVVGTESRGLSSDTIESLPSVLYKAESTPRDSDPEQCVICRLDYEEGESLVVLACKHSYHSECVNKWLQISKTCPVCSAEVSAVASSSGQAA